MERGEVGAAGEEAAANFLRSIGYRIIERHATAHWAELDIVADDGGTIVFVEVRSRSGTGPIRPEDTVVGKKRLHLERSVDMYLRNRRLVDRPWRFDVVAVEFSTDPPTIRHYKGM